MNDLSLSSIRRMGIQRNRESVPRLVGALSSPDVETRVAATISLSFCGNREAVPPLMAIRNDPNPTVRRAVRHALEHLTGNPEGGTDWKTMETALIGRLDSTDKQQVHMALEALGHIGGDAGKAAIRDYLIKHPDDELRVLMGVHASVLHFRILEALERLGSHSLAPLVPRIIESIPADKDRGLLYELDSYEKLTARIIQRSGETPAVVAACLQVLGADSFNADPVYIASVSLSPHAEKHIRKHSAQARAAQVLSVVCENLDQAGTIRDLLRQYRAAEPSETRSWVCFMLTRTLGRLGDRASEQLFVDMLEKDPTETALGLNAAPANNIYKGWRLFYRPAAAWALGQLKAVDASDTLLGVVENLDNASSTREQAAAALGLIGNPAMVGRMQAMAEEYPEITTLRAILRSIEQLQSGSLAQAELVSGGVDGMDGP